LTRPQSGDGPPCMARSIPRCKRRFKRHRGCRCNQHIRGSERVGEAYLCRSFSLEPVVPLLHRLPIRAHPYTPSYAQQAERYIYMHPSLPYHAPGSSVFWGFAPSPMGERCRDLFFLRRGNGRAERRIQEYLYPSSVSAAFFGAGRKNPCLARRRARETQLTTSR
jgi:hypothetical protein